MSTLLTQTSQTTEVKSNAKIGDFLYEFTYNYDPTKKITKLSCSIFNESRSVSYGVINLENSRRTVSLEDDENFNTHVTNFDNCLAEIKAGLSA